MASSSGSSTPVSTHAPSLTSSLLRSVTPNPSYSLPLLLTVLTRVQGPNRDPTNSLLNVQRSTILIHLTKINMVLQVFQSIKLLRSKEWEELMITVGVETPPGVISVSSPFLSL